MKYKKFNIEADSKALELIKRFQKEFTSWNKAVRCAYVCATALEDEGLYKEDKECVIFFGQVKKELKKHLS